MAHTRSQLASYMDHTLLKPDATAEAIDRVVAEAREYGTASVCVNPCWVARVHDGLAGSGVATCTVIGFPLGATTTFSKVAETKEACANGADEIDMVINVGWLKAGDADAVRDDIAAVAEATHEAGRLLKVIIECCLLTDEEKELASRLTVEGGADFVKTSTGFSTSGAKAADVALMRRTVDEATGKPGAFGVKAAGGIHSLAEAEAMIEAGATRLGVSAAVKILQECAE